MKEIFALICIILIISICFPLFQNIQNNMMNAKTNFDVYCAVYPYSYNNMTSLNQTDFTRQVEKVKEIGFHGVILYNVECFYDENKLNWVMDLFKSNSLNVWVALDYFNRTYNFPFPSEAWNYEGFRINPNELELYYNYVKNVSLILRSYVNFKGYIIYFPFDSQNNYWEWYNYIKTIEYKWKYIHILNSIRQNDGHPIYAGVMLWNDYPIDIYRNLPKDLIYPSGFAFQPYNTIKDDIQKEKIRELYNYFRNYNVQIGEIGYSTQNSKFIHGLASSEDKKASMLIEFLNYMKTLKHNGFVGIFGLTDFPPENADFGLIDANYELKASGKAIREWIKQNCS